MDPARIAGLSGDELPLLVGTSKSMQMVRYGGLITKEGNPLMDELTGEQAISNSNDFNSLISAGGHLFLVSHYVFVQTS